MAAAAFAGGRVLGMFPHPDDEAYAAGGTLALCAMSGAEVQVVCATRGERGTHREDAGITPAALGALRVAELHASCRVLGAGAPLVLGLPDGDLGALGGQAIAEVAELIERAAPDVLITLGRDGVYGSLDHVAWTGVVEAAVALLADTRVPRLLHTVFPRALFAPLWGALHRRPGRPVVASAVDPDALGVVRGDVDLCVDIRSVRERKYAAVVAHRSQLRRRDPATFLWPGVMDRLLDEEWFVVVRGSPLPSGATHPLAGL